jgi:CBS domain-containing protein
VTTVREIMHEGVECIAEGGDPRPTTAGDPARGVPARVDAGTEIEDAMRLMEEHKNRRLPVTDDRRLVGMLSEAEPATGLGKPEAAQFAGTVRSAPPTP